MTPRVIFPNKVLPYLLLAPQLAITLVFFYWPASQALYQSMLREDPFGLRVELRLVRQFPQRAGRPELPELGAGDRRLLASSTALRLDGDRAAAGGHGRQGRPRPRHLPHAADLALCGGAGDRRHAVAVPVQPVDRHARLSAARAGHRLGPAAQRPAGDGAGRRGRRVEADQLQFPVLRRRAAGDPEDR